MLPNFLFPETQVRNKEGEGPAVAVESGAGKMLQLTLGIVDVNEQSSLDVAIFGSADGAAWEAKPLIAFPQKFYKGTYTVVLDLTPQPQVQHLKVKYKANRWGHWTTGPEFAFYVFAEVLSA